MQIFTWLKNLAGRPKPVLNSASVGAAITVVVGAGVTFGILPQAQGTSIINASTTIAGSAFTIFAALSTLIAALHGSQKVTPLESPVNAQGKTLVPLAVTAVQDAGSLSGTNVSLGNTVTSSSVSIPGHGVVTVAGVPDLQDPIPLPSEPVVPNV